MTEITHLIDNINQSASFFVRETLVINVLTYWYCNSPLLQKNQPKVYLIGLTYLLLYILYTHPQRLQYKVTKHRVSLNCFFLP